MNPLMIKILGGALALLLLALLVTDRNRWKEKATDRQEQLTAICQATRQAASNPKLDCKRAGEQIRLLGESLQAKTVALELQNGRVQALGVETRRQQAAAAAAVRSTERSRAIDRTRAGLEASARSSTPQRVPCAPSEAVRRAWQ